MGGPRSLLANAVQRIIGRKLVARVDHMRYSNTYKAISSASETLSNVKSRCRRRRGISRYVYGIHMYTVYYMVLKNHLVHSNVYGTVKI